MTARTLAARTLSITGEAIRLTAFLCIAFLVLASIANRIAPESARAGLDLGPGSGVFVVSLALIGVAYLAVELRELGNRLGSTTRR